MSNARIFQHSMVAALLAMSAASQAYEVQTHRQLSELAATRSRTYANTDGLFGKLGFPAPNVPAFTASDPGISVGLRTFPQIVSDGAWWEDEQYLLVVCNHFFDPQANNGQGGGLTDGGLMTVLGCRGTGHPSPLWSLEDLAAPRDIAVPGPNNFHHFSMRRAYASLRTSLMAFSPAERRAAMSLTLQSLGHVIHHLQDMAQPQHTRDEEHAHDRPPLFPGHAVGAYEMYTRDRGSLPGTRPSYNEEIATVTASNLYPAFDLARFPTARHMWFTPNSAAPAYVGMAEFSAYNFPSFKKSFRTSGLVEGRPTTVEPAPGHPLPNGTNVDGTPRRIAPEFATVRLKNGQTREGMRYYVRGNVFDGLSGHTHHDRPLGLLGLKGDPTESLEIFRDRHEILLPRAVAFSSAYIDYFFRGRIALVPTSAGDQWIIRNTGSHTLDGRVVLSTENAAEERYSPPSGATFYVTLAPGQERIVTFQLPDDARKVVAMFEGRIGTEGETTYAGLDELTPAYNHVTGDIINAPPLPNVEVSSGVVALPGTTQGTTVGITLSAAPRSTTTVSVARVSGSTNISATPTQLTFTPSNYNVPQLVSISGSPAVGAQSATFSIAGARVNTTNFTVNQAAIPVACGGPFINSPSGSNFTTNWTHSSDYTTRAESTVNMGSTAGNVRLYMMLPTSSVFGLTRTQSASLISSPYNAGSPPTFTPRGYSQTVRVFSGGQQIASGSNSYGVLDLTFYFNPATTGSNSITIQEDFPWYDVRDMYLDPPPIIKQVSCPGGSLNTAANTVRATFETGTSTLYHATGSNTLSICGTYSANVAGHRIGPRGTVNLPRLPGNEYRIVLNHTDPECGSTYGTRTQARGRYYYNDGRGFGIDQRNYVDVYPDGRTPHTITIQ